MRFETPLANEGYARIRKTTGLAGGLLLLDEPMNGLDENGIETIRTILKNYTRENSATILLASHNKEDIHELCDEVYLVKDKNVVLNSNKDL